NADGLAAAVAEDEIEVLGELPVRRRIDAERDRRRRIGERDQVVAEPDRVEIVDDLWRNGEKVGNIEADRRRCLQGVAKNGGERTGAADGEFEPGTAADRTIDRPGRRLETGRI